MACEVISDMGDEVAVEVPLSTDAAFAAFFFSGRFKVMVATPSATA